MRVAVSKIKPQTVIHKEDRILTFLSRLKEKYNLNTAEDWNSITQKHIKDNGGSTLLHKYSMFEIKCLAFPDGKSIFNKPNQVSGYWDNIKNVQHFFEEIKEKFNLNTPEDWNSITQKHIKDNGGSALLNKYSMFDIKCLACPEGKSIFNNTPNSCYPKGYWENQENIDQFLSGIKEKYNLNTPEDWNLITKQHIQSNGGSALLSKYSMFDIKCMACPDGKLIFNYPKGYWENQENIDQFLAEIKKKYNLNTPEDWNSITQKHIISNGGKILLSKYSMFEIKCLACPEGKSIFNYPKQAPGYWKNQENIDQFLSGIKEKYNLNTPDDWNSITQKHIQSNGGGSLLVKYSLFEIKCMACPDGKSIFSSSCSYNPKGYWENKENIDQFLLKIKEKYNLNTPKDWNSITQKHIKSNGGSRLLSKYSLYEIKCLACPDGKSIFSNSHQAPGFWENQENIDHFLLELKGKYNLNTPEDWNLITTKHIQSNGGSRLLSKYSMFDIKCMACPNGKSIFKNPPQAPGYWEKQENIDHFLSGIKEKFNLKTPDDWKRISKYQIISQGGWGLFNNRNIKVKFDNEISKSIPLLELISGSVYKRSSQRWLFLQIQKLFPHEEIVEDYFHSEISRISGAIVQFDVFMIHRNIAIEYHGKHHYEDIPEGFSSLETYKHRDLEKLKLCEQYGIQMVVIPYWWDNKIDSLRETLYSKIK